MFEQEDKSQKDSELWEQVEEELMVVWLVSNHKEAIMECSWDNTAVKDKTISTPDNFKCCMTKQDMAWLALNI